MKTQRKKTALHTPYYHPGQITIAIIIFNNKTTSPTSNSIMSNDSDPNSNYHYYEFMHRHLSVRERELRTIKDEYAFLQSCGGVSMQDMAYFRASVLRHALLVDCGRNNHNINNNNSNDDIVVVKQEGGGQPPPPPLSSPIISLKSMLLDIITRDQADNINKICRHVRPLLEREGIRTFCRHHATHVRAVDQPRVAELLQREGVV